MPTKKKTTETPKTATRPKAKAAVAQPVPAIENSTDVPAQSAQPAPPIDPHY